MLGARWSFDKARLVAFLAVVSSLVSMAGTGAAADYYVVKRAHLDCIRSHVDAYLATNKNVIVIIAGECPKTSFSDDDIMSAAQNMLPNMANVPSTTRVDNVLVFKKHELRCLTNAEVQDADETGQYVKLRKQLCK